MSATLEFLHQSLVELDKLIDETTDVETHNVLLEKRAVIIEKFQKHQKLLNEGKGVLRG